MLRTLFKFNVVATLAFAVLLALLPDLFWGNLGFEDISDGMKAVSFVWGFSIQTGMAASQFLTSSAPHKSLLAHGKVHAAWWTTCGVGFFLAIPKLNAFAIANIGFMLAYGAVYGYYSFVEPPKES